MRSIKNLCLVAGLSSAIHGGTTFAAESTSLHNASTPAPTMLVAQSSSPKVEAAKPVAPKVEAAKPVAPKVEAAQPVAPKVEAAKPVAPKIEAAKPVEPKLEAAKPVAPKVEAAKSVAPKVESAKPVAPKVEAAKPVAPKIEAAQPVAPKVEAAKPVAPKVEATKPAAPKVVNHVGIPTNMPPDKFLISFLDRYCIECHDSTVQKGDRDFESFGLPLKNVPDLISAKEIIDQIVLKEMPPKKSEQPDDQERLALLNALRNGTTAARKQMESSNSRTVLRRLSNREYESTLAALFGRRVDTLGLTAEFPKEKTSQHLDTIGQTLVTSGFLVDQYFQAANRLVETRLGKAPTKPLEWVFNKNFKQYEELQGSHQEVFKFRYLNLYEQPNTDTRQGGYGHIEDFLKGVPVSGLYDLEVEAAAMHRDTHYDPTIFKNDLSEPFQLAVVTGDVRTGHIHYPQAIEPILGKAIVPDKEPTRLKFRVWLEAGQTPRFIFPNGPYESRRSVLQANAKYKDEFNPPITKVSVSRSMLLRQGKLPHIRISEVKVSGPVQEAGGSLEEETVFGKGGFNANTALEQLYAFAERAYRRPLKDGDRQPIAKLYQKRIETDKMSPRQAALDSLKLILCSPSFLYLSEITEEDHQKLKPFDLASRLSYALWSAPPDAKLYDLAKQGSLTSTEVLRSEIRRMLADDRVDGFIHGFLDSWLSLRDLGSQPPPRELFEAYYAEDYPTSMKGEARMFFKDLLKNNGSVKKFLNADYTFVDKKLAKLYQLPEKDTLRLADGFRKVSLKGNKQRGGVMSMAAVLTVSANGVETSPVTRGIWVSENILGIYPPPPPDEVPAIEPDVSGATTVRERLAKHSSDPTCGDCHRKIDPLGFSLEAYDPIGIFRNSYPKRPNSSKPAPKVDTTGEFSSGATYLDFDGFRNIIASSRDDFFVRNLIRKLLSYTTGRHMEIPDDYVIEEIHERAKTKGLGLETLIEECLISDIFRNR